MYRDVLRRQTVIAYARYNVKDRHIPADTVQIWAAFEAVGERR